MKANIGDTLEAAIWLDGREKPWERIRFKREIEDELRRVAADRGHVLGPIEWTLKLPGDERVPPVPDGIAGPDVRLLVGEVRIVGSMIPLKRALPGFAHDLEANDLAKLRQITRLQYLKNYPGYPPLTDLQCDTLINDLGPKVAAETLRNITMTDLI